MPVQHKHSKDPGDNKEMMQARRRFLELDHYSAMRDKVTQVLTDFTSSNNTINVLDLGCGEGFYTHAIERQLQQSKPSCQVYGLDISKVAIRYAAKRYTKCNFCVASSHHLPFPNESLQAVVRIYAPCKKEELIRCIAKQGIIITVTPASRHLYQLKELIYQNVHLHDETPESIDGFQLIHNEKLYYSMSLTGESASDVLQMTPFAWRATDKVKYHLKTQPYFQCDADFSICVYKKTE